MQVDCHIWLIQTSCNGADVVGVCEEFDFVTQGRDTDEAMRMMEAQIALQILLDKEAARAPLAGIRPPPRGSWADAYDRKPLTIRSEEWTRVGSDVVSL